MSSINDISNTDASLNSETVPTSSIDRSDKYHYNPQKPAVAASSSVPRPEKADNRKGGITSNAKGGAGANNWYGSSEQALCIMHACLPVISAVCFRGGNVIDEQILTAAGGDTKVP